MNLNIRSLRQPCLAAASLVLIVLSAFVTAAKPNGSRATAQTSSSGETVLTLSDFGAVGDGVADDGPALQLALDVLAEAGGGTLFIPAGKYLISTPVTKDFLGTNATTIKIQGVPSDTMPAHPTANGQFLAAGLDLVSEIIPATGDLHDAINLSSVQQLTIEHIAFTGQPSAFTDAFVTVYLSDIEKATIRHCEFYGISTFGLRHGFGGGNVVRAVRSELSIELSVFLGCTANSGAYAAIVENVEWKKFSISNSIFLDYGLRAFFGKMGLGAPLSWINIANAAAVTPESQRREIVMRDIFLDEGGWVGISAFPRKWDPASAPIDLIYISGLKMNVSNLGTAGHLFYDARNLLIENSHYGWSHNTVAAIDINRFEHAILNRLTCIDDADRIRADENTGRLTVINSEFEGLDSLAHTTTVLETSPENDPVQYVRQQFLSILGKQPEPAAHFYWSDMLIRCGDDNECLNQLRSELSDYLKRDPNVDFAIAGTVKDESGAPLSGVPINLTGGQTGFALTDSQGNFRFVGLPTSGSYTVGVDTRHYTASGSQTFVRPATNVTAVFTAQLKRHTIRGRIAKWNGVGISGVSVQLLGSPNTVAVTDASGAYTFSDVASGGDYTVVPSLNDFVFTPFDLSVNDLADDRLINFNGQLPPEVLMIESSDMTIGLDTVTLVSQPSLFNSLGFSTDGFIRVMVFAKNLEGYKAWQVLAVAKDDEDQEHRLDVEFAGDVAGQNWLKQLNLKISPAALGGKCVQLKIAVDGLESNAGRLCLAAP
ncbi:MAG TPA: carboxypeptidase regulatory-like domain-containing protein [Pyrinomonadaceae bacterium]|nr:carboxypeptidase regulatory-like domain-containing protein [Pyrinomonadaceae bacterium]